MATLSDIGGVPNGTSILTPYLKYDCSEVCACKKPYDPASMMEDFFFVNCSNRRESKVEKLSELGVPMDGTGELWPTNLHEYVELAGFGLGVEWVHRNTWHRRTRLEPDLPYEPLSPSMVEKLTAYVKAKLEESDAKVKAYLETVRAEIKLRRLPAPEPTNSWHNLAAKIVAPCLQPRPLDVQSSYRPTRYTEHENDADHLRSRKQHER